MLYMFKTCEYVPELRMQERVFMGMGRKPFMDIQPSDAAICDRAISCALPGRSKELHTKRNYEDKSQT